MLTQFADVPVWIWATFMLFVFGMLALDLGVFHRKTHEVKPKEALIWSGVWIALALVFNMGILALWDRISPSSGYTAVEAATAFLAGYTVEKALSVDNIFVFIVVFGFFQVPAKYQHKVLFWGILGALVFRAAFIAAGASLLERFHWMVIVFGVFLILTGVKLLGTKHKQMDPSKNPVVKLFKKFFPVTPDFVGSRFWTKMDGRLAATPLFLTLLVVEFTDVVFAVDSIPAIFAITSNPFIVFTSNIFAILGLRSLYFALAGLMGMFKYLSLGLAGILIFVGGKMIYSFWGKFPVALSLGIIVGILALSMLASVRFGNRPAVGAKPGAEDVHA